MSVTPMIAGTGMVGWQMLQNTLANQQRAFESSAEIRREGHYFRENVGSVETPEDLVSDRRLLRVALAAFGMEEETDNKRLIQKVLEEGTGDSTSLANRLNDSRYVAFADVFNFEVSVEEFILHMPTRSAKNWRAALRGSSFARSSGRSSSF